MGKYMHLVFVLCISAEVLYSQELENINPKFKGIYDELKGEDVGPGMMNEAAELGPGIMRDINMGPGMMRDPNIGPGMMNDPNMGPGMIRDPNMGPGMMRDLNMGPDMMRGLNMGPGMMRDPNMGPGMMRDLNMEPGMMGNIERGQGVMDDVNMGANAMRPGMMAFGDPQTGPKMIGLDSYKIGQAAGLVKEDDKQLEHEVHNVIEPVPISSEKEAVPVLDSADIAEEPVGQPVLNAEDEPQLIHIPLQLDDSKLQNANEIIDDQEKSMISSHNITGDGTAANTSELTHVAVEQDKSRLQNAAELVGEASNTDSQSSPADSGVKSTSQSIQVQPEQDDIKLQGESNEVEADQSALAKGNFIPNIETKIDNTENVGSDQSQSFQSQTGSSLSEGSDTLADHDVFVNIHQAGDENRFDEEQVTDSDAVVIDVDIPSEGMKDDTISLNPSPDFPLGKGNFIPNIETKIDNTENDESDQSQSFQSQTGSSLSEGSDTPADHDVFVNIHQAGAENRVDEKQGTDSDAVVIDVDIPSEGMKDDTISLNPSPDSPLGKGNFIPNIETKIDNENVYDEEDDDDDDDDDYDEDEDEDEDDYKPTDQNIEAIDRDFWKFLDDTDTDAEEDNQDYYDSQEKQLGDGALGSWENRHYGMGNHGNGMMGEGGMMHRGRPGYMQHIMGDNRIGSDYDRYGERPVISEGVIHLRSNQADQDTTNMMMFYSWVLFFTFAVLTLFVAYRNRTKISSCKANNGVSVSAQKMDGEEKKSLINHPFV
ncbi:hypothetical protein ScPMuIL_005066 [Solemya velum]